MPFCPKCGAEVTEEDKYCRNCGEILIKQEDGRIPTRPATQAGAVDHLTLGVNIAMGKPMVFAPALISGAISVVISVFSRGVNIFPYLPLFVMTGLISIIGAIISYILNFASIDMSRDAYLNTPLDITESVNYVLRRIVTFILASIVGGVMFITIILIPVSILMFVIIVIDETGIRDSISKAFNVIMRDIGDVTIVIIISIVGSLILGWVPFVGGLLTACLNVIIGLSFIDIYFKHKGQTHF